MLLPNRLGVPAANTEAWLWIGMHPFSGRMRRSSTELPFLESDSGALPGMLDTDPPLGVADSLLEDLFLITSVLSESGRVVPCNL